jgi:Domain of unknown function (DUF4352)/Protein of unknown function (DUF2510)
MSTQTGTPAGWYPQPDGQQRYWDGSKWTDSYAPAAAVVIAPKKPWFKKKRIMIPLLGLVAIIAMASAGGGGSTKTPVAQTDAAAPAAPVPAAKAAPAAPVPAAKAAPGIGSKVLDGKFEFTVTKVEKVGPSFAGQFGTKEVAQGEFIIVRVNVKNVGNEAQMLDSSSQKLINSAGQKFDPSTAIMSIKGADKFFLTNINPGNSVMGAPVLFDVAAGTKIASIELHDSPFSDGVKVAIK